MPWKKLHNPSSLNLTGAFLLLSTTILLLRFHRASGAGAFIYSGCSPSKFDPNAPFQSNLNSLLSSIVASSGQSSYNSFAAGNSSSSPPGSAAYGLYQCRTDLSAGDCSACVQSAVGQVGLVCPDADAGTLQLEGCIVRYSSEDFLGRLDTALAYRKCGPTSSGGAADQEFLRRRDDVIAGLQAGAEFRVSSSGAVQGYAQCLGDLSAGDCSACLGQAVGQLENGCGSALAADVFLAQCYARFWASGYYLHSSADYTDDDIGRTVAIIIGILAGLAVFVVFISFLKRACKFPSPHPSTCYSPITSLFPKDVLLDCRLATRVDAPPKGFLHLLFCHTLTH